MTPVVLVLRDVQTVHDYAKSRANCCEQDPQDGHSASITVMSEDSNLKC